MSPSSRLRLAASVLIVSLMAPLGVADTADAAEPVPVVTPVVTGLSIPWDLTWAGELMLFDERAGRLWSKRPDAPPQRVSLPLPPLFVNSEGGLLGLVADPDAATNGYFYTCMSVATASGSASDVQVWKWRLTSDTTAEKVQVLVKGIPIGHGRHNGCRLRFRSAGMLYIGTGDAAKGTNPQNLKSLGGKILRISADGTIPRTNPFYARGGNARYVWNYGHRNVQGLAWDAQGDLWASEFGARTWDELNLIRPGANYGWPQVEGTGGSSAGFVDPLVTWPTDQASPSGIAVADGTVFLASLRGERLWAVPVGAGRAGTPQSFLVGELGRLRTVAVAPDGSLWLVTSNTDGRGQPRPGDDRIVRLTLTPGT